MDKYLLDRYIRRDNKFGFASVFGEYNVEDFVKLGDRVDIRTTNHGHSSYLLVNGQKVKEDSDNTYVYLLTYIHYLGIKIKDFYKNLHHMNTMGFDYPDVFTYINKVMYKINSCDDSHVQDGKRPFPTDVVVELGEDYCNDELFNILHYKVRERGFKVASPVDYDRVVRDPNPMEKENLEEAAYNLLKLLEIDDDEVEERYRKARNEMQYEEVSIEELIHGKKKDPQLSKNRNQKTSRS